jgi:hypothetical protein
MNPATRKVRAGVPAAAVMLVLALTSQAISQGPPPPPPPPPGGLNNPPIIVSLEAQQVPGKKFRITGRVVDETPGRCGVTFGGVAAFGPSVGCDSEGNFTAIVSVPTLGQLSAVANDGQLNSAAAYKTLTNAAPTVSVGVSSGPNNTLTFSGSVGDECPEGLTVTLSGPTGVQGASATVGADGSYSITVTVPEGTSGNVTATVVDWYGASGSGYTSIL